MAVDSRKRSILKAITYRVICVIVQLSLTFAWTNNISESIVITVATQTILTIAYYVHERVWVDVKIK